MRLFLIRHGTAEVVSGRYTEENRPLTSQGQAEATASAALLARLAGSCRSIWVSPYERARQTAAAIARSLGGSEVTTHAFLMPDEDPSRASAEILKCVGRLEILCAVGHQPHIGRLLQKLCRTPEHSLEVPPASIVEVHIDAASPGSRVLNQKVCALIPVWHLQAYGPGAGL